MSISIRAATEADVDTLSLFSTQIALETEDRVLDPATVRAGCHNLIIDQNKGLFYVAEFDGQIAGQTMVTYEWSDWQNACIWWIQSVYVAPRFRKQGIFRQLYNHVRQEAQKNNACGIKLYAYNTNTSAHETYRALGMESHNIVFEDMFS